MPGYDVVIAAPNSAIDSYYELESLEVGKVSKARRAFHTAGGKGINAARALRNLGGRPLCIGLAAGHAGRFILEELDREGMAHDMVWAPGESRRCNTFYCEGQEDTTGVLESGAECGAEIVRAFGERIRARGAEAPFVALVGSLPPGFPDDFYASAIRELKARGVRVCLDSSGPALREGAGASPAMIKVNRAEFQAVILGEAVSFSPDHARDAFRELCDHGLEILVITDGKRGADIFCEGGELIHVWTPVEKIVSSAGSGDTFLSAILLALGRGQSLEDAAAFASAAAAANLMQLGCGVFDPAAVPELLGATVVAQNTWR